MSHMNHLSRFWPMATETYEKARVFPQWSPGWWRDLAYQYDRAAKVAATCVPPDKRMESIYRNQATACRNNALFADPDLREVLA